jgi:hypothetical protein
MSEKSPLILPAKYLCYTPQVFLTCHKILRLGADGFTSPPKKALRIFVSLKNTYSSAGFEPANLESNGKQDNP